MKVELIKSTRGIKGSDNGLITIRYEIPIYLHTELLTHRRSVRNASSARAMSTDRYSAMGHYVPPIFYKKGNGMQASDEPIKHQTLARLIWSTAYKLDVLAAKLLEYLDVSKEQRNRVINPTKYIAGMVTMTEHGWQHFLSLRTASNADKAMQVFAKQIKYKIEHIEWDYSEYHIPYDPYEGSIEHRMLVAAARISRLSYNKFEGKNDIESAQRLIRDKHMSPFEHIAEYTRSPGISALFCKQEDCFNGYGWKPLRSSYEEK